MATDNKQEQQHDEFGARGATVKATTVSVLVFAVLSLLFNGPWVQKAVSDSEYAGVDKEGNVKRDWREIKLRLNEPFDVASTNWYFDVPRRFVEEKAGDWLNAKAIAKEIAKAKAKAEEAEAEPLDDITD